MANASDLGNLQAAYESGRLTWADAIDAVRAIGFSKATAEEIVSEWDLGDWGY